MKEQDELMDYMIQRKELIESGSEDVQPLLDKIDFEIRILMKWLFVEKI